MFFTLLRGLNFWAYVLLEQLPFLFLDNDYGSKGLGIFVFGIVSKMYELYFWRSDMTVKN